MFDFFVELEKKGEMKIITSPDGLVGFQYPWWFEEEEDAPWFHSWMTLCEQGFIKLLIHRGFRPEIRSPE